VDSRRWLAALGALTLALAAALVADLARGGGAARGGRILPDWDPAGVRAIRIEHRGRPAVLVAKEGTGWRIAEPIAAPADSSAVADLLGTLEIMSARRHGDHPVSDPLLSVQVERTGRPPVTLDLAEDAGRTDRVWLSRRGEDHRALVDGYLMRALDLAVDDLRERRPFRGRLRGATRIRIAAGGETATELEGPPWRVGGVRADPDRVAAFIAALERLRAGSFLASSPSGTAALSIEVIAAAGTSRMTVRGDCPGGAGAAADTSLGPACLPADEVSALIALAGAPAELQDRRLLAAGPDEVSRVRLGAGARSIELARAEQAEVVRDWAARFAASAAAGAPIAAADLPVIGRIEVETDGGREELEILRAPGGTPAARRAGEPVAFRLADATLVDPAPKNFRSLDLISADPTALRSARRGPESIERGELLEEWRALAPAGAAVDVEAAENLALAVATLRAVRVAPDRPRRPGVSLLVELAPAPGESQPVRHRIGLAAGPRATCTARLDDDPTDFELAPATCAALLRPLTIRPP